MRKTREKEGSKFSSSNNYKNIVAKIRDQKDLEKLEETGGKFLSFEHAEFVLLQNPQKYSIKIFQDTGQINISYPQNLRVP